MESNSSSPLFNPKTLRNLALNLKYSNRDTLLHKFVLHYSDLITSGSKININEFLKSVPEDMVNLKNDRGYTALHFAVLKEDLLMVKKLVSLLPKIDVNIRCNVKGNAALHMATHLHHLLIIEELLSKGAHINLTNCCGLTALCIAAHSGDIDVMKLLVSKGASVKVTANFACPVHCAVIGDNLEAVKYLVEQGADWGTLYMNNINILHLAARYGHLTIVEYFINLGADVNAEDGDGKTPLFHAAQCGHLAIVQYLVSKGPELNDKNGSCLLDIATESGHLDVLRFLLNTIPNVDVNKLLINALRTHKLESIQFLLENGAEINPKTVDAIPPLHFAIAFGYLDIVKLFLDYGADPNAKGIAQGNTILHQACNGDGHLDIIKLLISKGSDVNAVNEVGQTPLYISINNLDYTLLLLERGANVNIVDVNGWTPLHAAVDKGNSDVVKALLEKGANKCAKDIDGITPLDLARYYENQSCIDVLQ